jgi:hypothetical protein
VTVDGWLLEVTEVDTRAIHGMRLCRPGDPDTPAASAEQSSTDPAEHAPADAQASSVVEPAQASSVVEPARAATPEERTVLDGTRP